MSYHKKMMRYENKLRQLGGASLAAAGGGGGGALPLFNLAGLGAAAPKLNFLDCSINVMDANDNLDLKRSDEFNAVTESGLYPKDHKLLRAAQLAVQEVTVAEERLQRATEQLVLSQIDPINNALIQQLNTQVTAAAAAVTTDPTNKKLKVYHSAADLNHKIETQQGSISITINEYLKNQLLNMAHFYEILTDSLNRDYHYEEEQLNLKTISGNTIINFNLTNLRHRSLLKKLINAIPTIDIISNELHPDIWPQVFSVRTNYLLASPFPTLIREDNSEYQKFSTNSLNFTRFVPPPVDAVLTPPTYRIDPDFTSVKSCGYQIKTCFDSGNGAPTIMDLKVARTVYLRGCSIGLQRLLSPSLDIATPNNLDIFSNIIRKLHYNRLLPWNKARYILNKTVNWPLSEPEPPQEPIGGGGGGPPSVLYVATPTLVPQSISIQYLYERLMYALTYSPNPANNKEYIDEFWGSIPGTSGVGGSASDKSVETINIPISLNTRENPVTEKNFLLKSTILPNFLQELLVSNRNNMILSSVYNIDIGAVPETYRKLDAKDAIIKRQNELRQNISQRKGKILRLAESFPIDWRTNVLHDNVNLVKIWLYSNSSFPQRNFDISQLRRYTREYNSFINELKSIYQLDDRANYNLGIYQRT
jgi:hypothetical protein